MLTLETTVKVEGMTAAEVFEFLANPDDASYRAWWPGVHHELHILARGEGHVGDVVHMDECIGERRLRMRAVVTEAVPARRMEWQLRKGLRLPARLRLDLVDGDGAVVITHITRAGFGGIGRVVDPLLRLYFSRGFAADLDRHVRTEFPLLRDLLRRRDEP